MDPFSQLKAIKDKYVNDRNALQDSIIEKEEENKKLKETSENIAKQYTTNEGDLTVMRQSLEDLDKKHGQWLSQLQSAVGMNTGTGATTISAASTAGTSSTMRAPTTTTTPPPQQPGHRTTGASGTASSATPSNTTNGTTTGTSTTVPPTTTPPTTSNSATRKRPHPAPTSSSSEPPPKKPPTWSLNKVVHALNSLPARISMPTVAASAGLSDSTVYTIRNGKNKNPEWETLEALRKYFVKRRRNLYGDSGDDDDDEED